MKRRCEEERCEEEVWERGMKSEGVKKRGVNTADRSMDSTRDEHTRAPHKHATCFLHPSTRGISDPGTTGKSRGFALAGEAPGASGAYLCGQASHVCTICRNAHRDE